MLAPILAPVAVHFGIDPVHFGLIMIVNPALGIFTTPYGVNLFAARTVARISVDQIVTRLPALRRGDRVPRDRSGCATPFIASPAAPAVSPARLLGAAAAVRGQITTWIR